MDPTKKLPFSVLAPEPKVEPERKRADSDPTVPTGSPDPTSPSGRRYFASDSSRPRFRPPQALQPNVLPLRLAARASSSSEEIPPRASSSSKSLELIESLERGSGREKIAEILGSIAEMPYGPVKLNVLLELVIRINRMFDSAFAAKLIADHVEPLARNIAASKDFAPTSKVGAKVQELYEAMKMPIEPVWALKAQKVSAAQGPVVRAQDPIATAQSRMWVSDEFVDARTRIGFLQRGKDPSEFEAACQNILTVVDKIENEHEKLDALKLLVSQINANAEVVLAGKIIGRDVGPRANELIEEMDDAEYANTERELGVFFAAMKVSVDGFLVAEASKQIVALQRGNDPTEFEAACQQVLTIVDKISDQRDKLNALMLLVSRINACSASDPGSAGKIFVERVEPQATELAANFVVADDSDEGATFRKLFDAMNEPTTLYLASASLR